MFALTALTALLALTQAVRPADGLSCLLGSHCPGTFVSANFDTTGDTCYTSTIDCTNTNNTATCGPNCKGSLTMFSSTNATDVALIKLSYPNAITCNTTNCNAPTTFVPGLITPNGKLQCWAGSSVSTGTQSWSLQNATATDVCVRASYTVQAGKTYGEFAAGTGVVMGRVFPPAAVESMRTGLAAETNVTAYSFGSCSTDGCNFNVIPVASTTTTTTTTKTATTTATTTTTPVVKAAGLAAPLILAPLAAMLAALGL